MSYGTGDTRYRNMEVRTTDSNGEPRTRKVDSISHGEGWAKVYAEKSYENRDATFYIDGKPQVTYHRK